MEASCALDKEYSGAIESEECLDSATTIIFIKKDCLMVLVSVKLSKC